MRCARVSSLVDRYVDGALPPRVAEEIERHAGACPRCAAEIATARRLLGALAAEPAVRAPRGFADRVMEAVYQQTPRSEAEVARDAERTRGRMPAPMYRRLGISFVLTAAVLTASLLIPRASYPSLFGGGRGAIGAESTMAVKHAMAGADSAVRGILGGEETGGTQ